MHKARIKWIKQFQKINAINNMLECTLYRLTLYWDWRPVQLYTQWCVLELLHTKSIECISNVIHNYKNSVKIFKGDVLHVLAGPKQHAINCFVFQIQNFLFTCRWNCEAYRPIQVSVCWLNLIIDMLEQLFLARFNSDNCVYACCVVCDFLSNYVAAWCDINNGWMKCTITRYLYLII